MLFDIPDDLVSFIADGRGFCVVVPFLFCIMIVSYALYVELYFVWCYYVWFGVVLVCLVLLLPGLA